MCLIWLCYTLVHVVWRYNLNPDNYAIPLLTGTGDLLGVAFLFVCFHLVYLTGNESVRYEPPTTKLFTTNYVNQTTFSYINNNQTDLYYILR